MAQSNQNVRAMPHSPEAEKAVLGCMLINSEAVSKALHHISSDSFYDNNNSTIFSAMSNLFAKSKSIDNVTIIDELKKNNKLDSIGGTFCITGLCNEAPTAQNVEYYAKIVKEKAVLRKIISTAIEMSNSAYTENENSNEVLDKAEQSLFNLSKDAERGLFSHIDPLLHDVLDKWGTRKKGRLTGVASGFINLDNILSGFQESDLIIVAGRPSMGKTALALALARNAAIDHKAKVGLFSLEMSNTQLVERLITSEARVDGHLVRTGRLPKTEWKKLSQAAGPLSEANIFIDDTPGLNIMELRAKARQLKAEKDIDILFIDYIQLLSAHNKSENRQQEISYISRSLKALAKELNIPIIALSQLSRAVENRTNHRPMLSDLRESGAIEQDADVILFVYRKYVYTRNEEDIGLGEIIVGKHRNGPTGLVNVTFIDKYALFENLDTTHSENEYSEFQIPN